MAYQTPDSKKEEFRKYLEKSGVIDALTKVLVGLYEEPESDRRTPSTTSRGTWARRRASTWTRCGRRTKTSRRSGRNYAARSTS